MKNVLIIGAARSGNSVCRLLLKQGYTVYITDQQAIVEKEQLEKEGVHVYEWGHPEALKHIEYECIVKNPGIPYTASFVHFFVEKGCKIYTEIEIAARYSSQFHYGAITGTNGKTTITSLLYALLSYNKKASVAGNIGVPLSEVVLMYPSEERDVALELSNFQLLGCETFHPEVAVVCNLSPDHLDYMESLDAYYSSKMKVYENQTKEDWFLRNVDDENVMKYARDIPSTIIDFSIHRQDVDVYIKEGVVYLHQTALFTINTLKIVGRHNLCNAMVAACMAYKLGVSIPHIQAGLSLFTGVEHRMEYVASYEGVDFYNDSKATNAEAVLPALQSFEKNIILLAGGYDKKLPLTPLGIFDQRIKCCFAFGQTKELFNGVFTHVSACQDMHEAFEKAMQIATPGDVVLLSPACASFDQFTSYEQRGELFKKYVYEYTNSRR